MFERETRLFNETGWTDSWSQHFYISQIENGRAYCPKGERLKAFLDLYGKIGTKYFYELVRDWEKERTDEDFIRDNFSKLSKDNQKIIKAMMETMLGKNKTIVQSSKKSQLCLEVMTCRTR